ncbi:MAG: leucyl aminopeptidase, partial [Rhodobiaceae bacterium]|nr:leucyl aminopeptidase [Rhodobiaceae bacterium]
MTQLPIVSFKKPALPKTGTVIVQAGDSGKLAPTADALDQASGGQLSRVLAAAKFKGKAGEVVEVLAPEGTGLDRVLIAALGEDGGEQDWLNFGGKLAARIKPGQTVAIFAEVGADGSEPDAAALAALGEGIMLRTYSFDKYKTKKDDDDKSADKAARVAIHCAAATAAKKAFAGREAVVGGTVLARDLVNEPANVLGPIEFAAKAKELEKLGAKVTILTERQMAAKKMNALLAVGQGSARESRLAIIEWNGGPKKEAPVCFVGKGVVFDTGGISLKPAASMEDMKGDMGGAAAVIGLMHALCARKAKVNVVGILGLVENMPDGLAQRPGDIVTS